MVWIGWPGASSNSATPLNRVYVIGTVVLLAALPLVVRRHFGPVRGGWAPRAARVGGYALVLALIAAKAVKDRDGSKLGAYFVVVPGLWAMEIVLLLVIAAYVAGLLILTSQRVRLTRWSLPVGIGFGAITAGVLYLLAPFGVSVDPTSPSLKWWGVAALALPLAAGLLVARLAARDTRPARLSPIQQGSLAASCAMATAALLLAVLTSVTIALFPHHVPLGHPGCRRGPDAAYIAGGGAKPATRTDTVIPPGLRHEYLGGNQRRPSGPDAPWPAPARTVPRRRARRRRRGIRQQITRHQRAMAAAARTPFHRPHRSATVGRASDADREQVIDALKAAFVQGRLTKTSSTRGPAMRSPPGADADLAALTADLHRPPRPG